MKRTLSYTIIIIALFEVSLSLFFDGKRKILLYDLEPYSEYLFLKNVNPLEVKMSDYLVLSNKLGWENKKGFISKDTNIDQIGVRLNSPIQLKRKKSIAIVGDSFVFGSESKDSETLTSFLEKSYPEFNFINLGGEGYGHDQMYLFLEKTLNTQKFDIDHVVLVYLEIDSVRNLMVARPTAKPTFSLELDSFSDPLVKNELPYILQKSNIAALSYGVFEDIFTNEREVTQKIILKMNKLLKERNISFSVLDAPQLYWDHEKKVLHKDYLKYEKKLAYWENHSRLFDKEGIKNSSISNSVIQKVIEKSVYNENYSEHWCPEVMSIIVDEIKENDALSLSTL